MKKRSLFAAVAMLIVSAVVLTSATYAWFAGNTTATVGTITGTIGTSDASILVSEDNGAHWRTGITTAQFQAAASSMGYSFPAALTPVSYDGAKFVYGSISQGVNFTADDTATTSGYIISYSFKIKSSQDCTVTITPNFNDGGSNFVYGVVTCGTDKVIHGGYSYYPVTKSGTATDMNGNHIIDNSSLDAYSLNSLTAITTDDTITTSGLVSASAISPDNGNIASVSLTAETPVTVTVKIWAEGQSPTCTGSTAATATMGFTITKDVSQQGGGGNG